MLSEFYTQYKYTHISTNKNMQRHECNKHIYKIINFWDFISLWKIGCYSAPLVPASSGHRLGPPSPPWGPHWCTALPWPTGHLQWPTDRAPDTSSPLHHPPPRASPSSATSGPVRCHRHVLELCHDAVVLGDHLTNVVDPSSSMPPSSPFGQNVSPWVDFLLWAPIYRDPKTNSSHHRCVPRPPLPPIATSG
jgi:hypothetical protein